MGPFWRFGLATRVGLALLSIGAGGCTRSTGHCDADDECAPGQSCLTAQRRCAEAVGLTLTKIRAGGSQADPAGDEGTIQSEPLGLVCGTQCSQQTGRFARDGWVKLTVTAGPGWRFGGWSAPAAAGGSCDGVTPNCVLSPREATQVTARFVRKVCHDTGWCWENPLPTANGLRDVWALAPDDVWGVGVTRTLIHWDGRDWGAVNLPLDGEDPNTRFSKLWASGPANVWAVAYQPSYAQANYLHWDGRAWTRSQWAAGTNTLGHLWGSGAADIWSTGDGGSIAHYDGNKWSGSQGNGGGGALRGVWGASEDDVWIAGANGTVLRGGKAGFVKQPLPAEAAGLYFDPIWGTSASDVWVISNDKALSWNGSMWNVRSPGVSVSELWGDRPENHWLVGAGIVHWNGTTFDKRLNDWPALHGVHGTAANDVWSVGVAGTILHYDGTAWSSHSSAATNSLLIGLWGSAADDIWGVGHNGTIIHWNGVGWSSAPSGTTKRLYRVWGSGSRDVWAVGGDASKDGVLLHYDGTRWSIQEPTLDARLLGVGGSGPQDVWTVGDNGTIRHYDGAAWKPVKLPGQESAQISGIWSSGPDEAWIVGANIYHYQAGTWDVWPSLPQGFKRLINVFGRGREDVWAVGIEGYSIHWDGRTWTGAPSTMDCGINCNLTGIWVDAAGAAWAAGHKPPVGEHYEQGVLLKWDRAKQVWATVMSGMENGLLALWGTDANNLWAVGERGTVLHHQR